MCFKDPHNLLHFLLFFNTANKHKPWLEPTYHGIVTENDNTVLLDPPLIALDKDAPLRFAGRIAVGVSSRYAGTDGEASHTSRSGRFSPILCVSAAT